MRVRQTAEQVRQDLVDSTPVDTGRLRAGWRLQKGRNPAVYVIVNEVPYARAVEFRPRRGGFMGRVLARWHSRLR